MSGYRGNVAVSIDLSKIDAGGTAMPDWKIERDTPYVPSPLLYRGLLYVLKGNSGILTGYDSTTGRRLLGPQRLPDIRNVHASPVAAAGRIYVTSREGTTVVLRAGSELKVLATNTLDDEFDASASVAGREVYLRGRRFLYCITEAVDQAQ